MLVLSHARSGAVRRPWIAPLGVILALGAVVLGWRFFFSPSASPRLPFAPKGIKPRLTLPYKGAGARLLSFNGNGNRLVVVDGRGKAALWDADTGKILESGDEVYKPDDLSEVARDYASSVRKYRTKVANAHLWMALGTLGNGLSGSLSVLGPHPDRLYRAFTQGQELVDRIIRTSRAVGTVASAMHGWLVVPAALLPSVEQEPLPAMVPAPNTFSWSTQSRFWVAVTRAPAKLDNFWLKPGEKEKLPKDAVQVIWVASARVQYHKPDKEVGFAQASGQRFLYQGLGPKSTSSLLTATSHIRLAAFAPSGKVRLTARTDLPIVVERDEVGKGIPQKWDSRLVESKEVNAIVLAADIAVGILPGGAVAIWDLKTGKIRHRLAGLPRGSPRLALSANGKRLVTAGPDSELRTWDAISGEQLRSCNVKGVGIHRFAISANGKRAITTHNSSDAQLWDLENGIKLASFPPMDWPALSDDGTQAADLTGGQIRIWDLDGK